MTHAWKTKQKLFVYWELKVAQFWELQGTATSIGQDRPGFSLSLFLPALKRLGRNRGAFSTWKPASLFGDLCTFQKESLSGAQHAKRYQGRNLTCTEEREEQASEGGTGEEPEGRKGVLQKTGRNTCDRGAVTEGGQGQLLGWRRTFSSPAQTDSRATQRKCSATPRQCL